MPDLIVDRLPELHNPVAVVAFEGWNDAASAATDAARYLVNRLGGRRFASIDAERFYSFTDARPMVSILPGNVRRIGWQKNEFYYVRNPSGPHDIVIGIGVEPNLRWRSFAGAHAELYNSISVEYVVSLGALLADVPHTRPTRVTGSAFDPQVAERLSLTTSRYEGPTGIVESKVAYAYNSDGDLVASCAYGDATSNYQCTDSGTAPTTVRRTVYTYCAAA